MSFYNWPTGVEAVEVLGVEDTGVDVRGGLADVLLLIPTLLNVSRDCPTRLVRLDNH